MIFEISSKYKLEVQRLNINQIIDNYTISVPTQNGNIDLHIKCGHSMVILGANGSGKTRLGVHIENNIPTNVSKRISSHKSLSINDELSSVSFERAMHAVGHGTTDLGINNREYYRYRNKPAVTLVNDYDFILQALFAEESNAAVKHLYKHLENNTATPPTTILSKIKKIWEYILPHRRIIAEDLKIKTEITQSNGNNYQPYLGSDMSDGERVMLYLLGSILLSPPNSIIIIDEPELHLHKAILARFWDTIEAERKDCAFIYITHDLDFVAARPTATKLAVYGYTPEPLWNMEEVISDDDLPERLVNELIGSRQPVLFVEGRLNGVDASIYRAVYKDFLVEPIGGCQAVIHAVSTFRNKEKFHRLGQIYGCIDADARNDEDVSRLDNLNVKVLPVAEIENILLLRPVFLVLAKAMHFSDTDAASKFHQLQITIIGTAQQGIEEATARYVSRRLDGALKQLAPKSKTIEEMEMHFQSSIQSLNLQEIAETYRSRLRGAIDTNDTAAVLSLYDNKGLLSEGARILGLKGAKSYPSLLVVCCPRPMKVI